MANLLKLGFMLVIVILLLMLFNSMPAFFQEYANFIIMGITLVFVGLLILVLK